MFSSFSSFSPFSSTFFSLPDLKQALHAQLSSAVGHLLNLETLSQEQFDVRISGLSSTLTLRDVGLNPGVRIGGDNGAPSTGGASSAGSTASAASFVIMQTLPGGHIGHFSVSIPLSTLLRKTRSIEICLRDLEVVVGIEDTVSSDVARSCWEAEKRRMVEREVVREIEREREKEKGRQEEREGETVEGAHDGQQGGYLFGSLLKRLVGMGVARLQLRVEQVRVRVVDMKTGNDVAVCHIDRIMTVDEGDDGYDFPDVGDRLVGIPPPISQLVEGLVEFGSTKMLQVQGAGVRWCGGPVPGEKKTYASLDCTLHAMYALTSSPSQIMLRLRLDTLKAAVDMDEMADVMALIEDMEWRAVRRRVAHLRPPPIHSAGSTDSTCSSFDAREMWHFAINSVLLEMVGPVRFAAWRPEEQVMRDRRRYILLYRKMHDVRASMSTVGAKEIERLETLLSVGDVVACRIVAMRSAGSQRSVRSATATTDSSNTSALTEHAREGILMFDRDVVDATNTRQPGEVTSSAATNPKSSVLWSKIPALVDMEEQLFQALDIESPDALLEGQSDLAATSAQSLSSSKLQIVALLQVPRATANVHSETRGLDATFVVSDSTFGYVNDVIDDVDMSSMPMSSLAQMSSAAYATASVPRMEVTTPRGSNIGFSSPLYVEYLGISNVIRVEMTKGLDAQVAPEDIRALTESIPAASSESYSMHWIETAISMDKKAYCIEAVRRLQRLGNFVDFDVRIGGMALTVEGLDIRISLDTLALRTSMELENFEELRSIYRTISSFEAGADTEKEEEGTPLRRAMQRLEERLIYREMDVTLSNLSVHHKGIPVVYPLQGTAVVKMNRLYGDFLHPQVVTELSLGDVSVDMFDACLSSFMKLQEAFETSESAPEETWSIQRAISVSVGWPLLRLRWLAGEHALRHEFSVHAGQSSVCARVSFPRSKSSEMSLDVRDFKVLHSQGMESINIPMVDVQIPYFARSFSLDRLHFQLKDRPSILAVHFESAGIMLAGDVKDTSNYVRSTTKTDASIRASFVQRAGKAADLDAVVSNIDIGHGTLVRAIILSDVLSEGSPSQPQETPTAAPMQLRLDIVLQNIQCSFVHDMMYGRVSGTPVQYHDFSAIHSTVAQGRLARLNLQCDIGDKSTIRLLELDSLSASCGVLRETGAALGVIFDLPQIRCHIGDVETLLDCPEINGGISPYQVALLKGVLDLILFDQSRYRTFYRDFGETSTGVDHQTSDSGIEGHIDLSMTTRSAPYDLASLNFDPIRVLIGSLSVCLVGSVPSPGAVWLCWRCIELSTRPGDARLVWQTFDVFHQQCMRSSYILSREIDGASLAGSSDGDSSAVVYHDVAQTVSSSTSKFFDAASVVSRGISESSFMTSFYSVDRDEDESGGSVWDDVESNHPPLPDDEDAARVLKLSFYDQADVGVTLTAVTPQHVVVSLSPVQVVVRVDAAARVVHFLRTFERYLSNHILPDSNQSLSTRGRREEAGGGSLVFAQEILVEVDRVTLLLETLDSPGHDEDLESSLDANAGESRQSDALIPDLQHAVALSVGAQIRYTQGPQGQACSLDLHGLFASSFSLSGSLDNLSSHFLETHALLGNERCVIKGMWTTDTVDCNILCSGVSAWLTELNLVPVMRVIIRCQDLIANMNEGTAATDRSFGASEVGASAEPDGLRCTLGPIGGVKKATFDFSMHRLSIVIAAHALSRQRKHLCEFGVNDVKLAAQQQGGVLSTAASLAIEVAACRASDGCWITMLDETNVEVDACAPLDVEMFPGSEVRDSSDAVTLAVNIGPANFTMNRDVAESLSLCSMLVSALASPEQASLPAPYLTAYQLVNETSCVLCVALDGETFGKEYVFHTLEPGASLFPPQSPSPTYKAGTPDAKLGIKGLPPVDQVSTPALPPRRAYVIIEKQMDHHSGTPKVGGMHPNIGLVGTNATLSTDGGWISLGKSGTFYHSSSGTEIALHTFKSSSGTWKTRIRPCIRFQNHTDFHFEVAQPGSGEILATANPRQEVWLPLSATFGQYTLRSNHSDWCDGIRLTRSMAYQGYIEQRDVTFRSGASVVSMPLTISGQDGSVCVTVSPKLDVCNLMPIPIYWRFSPGANPMTVQPGCRLSAPNAWCNFPLGLEFSTADFADSRRVVVSEVHGAPVVKWRDEGWNEYVDALDVMLVEKPPGELYGRLIASKDLTSGTIIISIVAPVWVYNFLGVPVSFDCLMETDVSEDGGTSGVADDVHDPSPISATEDIVPESWIPPLESHSWNRRLVSERSMYPKEDPADIRTRPAKEADLGLAPVSPDTRTVISGGYTFEQNASSMPSPGVSLHYCVAGLGSLVSHTTTSHLSDSKSPEEIESSVTFLRHSRVAERLYDSEEAAMRMSFATTPTGLNARGARVMCQAVKRLRLRVTRQRASPGLSHWSTPVTFDAHRRQSVVLIPLPPVTTGMHLYNTRQGEFPVIVSLVQDNSISDDIPLSVDKLKVSPQFMIINELGREIVYRQQGAHAETRVAPWESSAVQWTDVGLQRKLSVRIYEAGWMWSGGFSLENAGDMFLKLRHRDRGITHVVRTEISHSSEDGTVRIVLRSNPGAFTPYRLDNCSLETLIIRQKGVADQQDVLRPYCSLNYTWDEPSMAHKITLERPGGQVIGSFDFDKVGYRKEIVSKKGLASAAGISSGRKLDWGRDTNSSDLVVRVSAEGPVRVLTIMDLGYHEMNSLEAPTGGGKEEEAKGFEFHCNVDSISLSIIHHGRERLYFGIHQTALACTASPSRMAVSGSIKFISLENTSPSCVYPVIFSLPAPESTLSSRVRKGVGESDPLRWEFTLWRDFRGLHNIACFDVADIYVRSFSVYIEQDLINLLMDMSASSDWTFPSTPPSPSKPESPLAVATMNDGRKKPRESTNIPDNASLRRPLTAGPASPPTSFRPKFYFDRISVSPVEFMISFNSSEAEDWNNWSGVLLQQVIALADIEDARVWLSGIQLSNMLFDQETMTSYVSTHYKRALILEIFKLVGAANVLGDPMATIQHIGLGFWEFVSFPAVGLAQSCRTLSPTDFVLGCVQGTKGLLQNVLFAVSNATTKASSAARKTIRLTWGTDSRSNPKESLLGATLRGMIGMVTEPVRGAEDGGLAGFLLGIRHGALGAVLIPASAWLEMCASLALSVRKAVAGTANVGWSRPPRSNELLPYDWTDSMGQWLFRQLQQVPCGASGHISDNEQYVCCSRLNNAKDRSLYLILTTKCVLAASAEGLNWTPKVIWSARLDMLEAVTFEADKNGVTLRFASNPGLTGLPGLRRREERRLFSVFQANFADEGQAASYFRTRLDICQNSLRESGAFAFNQRVW